MILTHWNEDNIRYIVFETKTLYAEEKNPDKKAILIRKLREMVQLIDRKTYDVWWRE